MNLKFQSYFKSSDAKSQMPSLRCSFAAAMKPSAQRHRRCLRIALLHGSLGHLLHSRGVFYCYGVWPEEPVCKPHDDDISEAIPRCHFPSLMITCSKSGDETTSSKEHVYRMEESQNDIYSITGETSRPPRVVLQARPICRPAKMLC